MATLGKVPAESAGLSHSQSAASLSNVNVSYTPTRVFRSVDSESTLDDPLDYRFDVHGYLASVALRKKKDDPEARRLLHEISGGMLPAEPSPSSPLPSDTAHNASFSTPPARSTAMRERGLSIDTNVARLQPRSGDHEGVSATPSSALSPGTAVEGVQSPQTQGRPALRDRRPSLSPLRNASDYDALDAGMFALQRRAVERLKRRGVEQAKAKRAEAERAQVLLAETLAREAQLRDQLRAEGSKLSPRSAEAVRTRMLLSRKPTRYTESTLRAVGMTLTNSPQPRRERDAFGQLKDVQADVEKLTRSRRRASLDTNKTASK